MTKMRWFTILLTLSIICIASSTFAQGNANAGLIIGGSYMNLHGKDADLEWQDPDGKFGLIGGAFITYQVNDLFGFRTELLYKQEGGKYGSGDDTGNFKLGYLTIPLFVQVTPMINRRLRPVFYVGPFLGINTQAKMKFELDGEMVDEDWKDLVESTAYGIMFGTSVISQNKWEMGARFNLGLNSVASTLDTDEGVISTDIKTHSIHLYLAWHLFSGD